MKKIIGITGGSGTGKSSVALLLKKRGAHVIDADLTARRVVECGKPALSEIKKHFGEKVINPDGSLNRKALGSIVFSDENELDILDKITHKYIKEDILNEIEKSDASLIVVDAALLHKGNLSGICDATVAVTACIDTRKKRIMARDNITEDAALSRITAQENDDYYVSLCDFILQNDGDLEDAENQLKKIIDDMETGNV